MQKRMAYIEIAGKEYPVRFSLGASKAITEKFGSLEGMTKEMVSEGNKDAIGIVIWILQLLIAQGCAYKNTFEADIPKPENAPVKDGKYIPLTAEELEIGMELSELKDIKGSIFEALGAGRRQEIQTKEKGGKDQKNAETT